MNLYQLFLLILITILLASAGNIINDYYDFDSDKINRKRANLLYSFKRVELFRWYVIVSSLCFIIIALLSYITGSILKPLFFLTIHSLLWLYSYKLKHKALIGNLVVAILSSLVVFVVYLFDSTIWALLLEDPNHIVFYLGGSYMFFAFVLSFLRELIKDIEDIEGDQRSGSMTLPVILGVEFSKILCCVILLLSMFVLLALIYIGFMNLSFLLIIILLILFVFPHLYIFKKIISAKDKVSFNFISKLIKAQMFIALFFLGLSKFLF